MTSTTRVPRTEITGLYGCLLKVAMRKMLGGVPEGAEVMWHHPRVFKDLMRFGGRTEKWDRLDRNLASLATMAAAAEVGCSFAWTSTTSRPTTRDWTRRRRARSRGSGSPRCSRRWSAG
jgi:alkylhydroperoxidase family enzyme